MNVARVIMNIMRIMILGRHMRNYPRNILVLDTLRRVHTTHEVDMDTPSLVSVLLLLFRVRHDWDALLLLQPARPFILPALLARFFWKGRIIGDMFTSQYDTIILDRKLAGRYSLKAVFHYLLDVLLVRACDTLWFDTQAHKTYVDKLVGLRGERTCIVPVCVDTARLRDVTPMVLSHVPSGAFSVFFGGYFIPLQGIETIIESARILKGRTDIYFTLLGSGQMRGEMESLVDAHGLTQVTFMPSVPYETYLGYMKGAHLSLGVFGTSHKARRVVSNKIVEGAGLGVPVLTGRSAPVLEVFTEGEDILCVPMGDAPALAQAILHAQQNPNLMRIGQNGKSVVEKHFSLSHLESIVESP
jgi:glycosyltransferase involved in cell wall biosynthesis